MSKENFFQPWTLFLFVLLFLATLKSHRTYMGQGDEVHYLVAAQSLAFDFDTDLRNNYNSPLLRTFNETQYHALPGKNGTLQPFHSIGLSILLVPSSYLAHGLVKLFGPMQREKSWIIIKNTASFSMMALAGLFGVLFMRFFILSGVDPAFSWILGGLIMISPPLMSYGFLLFPALPTAFIVLFLLVRLAEKKFHWTDQILLGFLPWLSPRNYLISGIFLALFLLNLFPSWKDLLKPKNLISTSIKILPSLFMWGIIFSLNHLMWGSLSPASPWTTTGHKVFDPSFLNQAVPGLLFDRSYGLLIYSPLYYLFPAGLAVLYRENKVLLGQILILLFSTLFAVSGYWDWKGGWSPGPRYLTPAMPFLAAGLGFFLADTFKKDHMKKMVFILIGFSTLLSILYWQDPRALWPGYVEPDVATGNNRFLSTWLGSWGASLQAFFPNLVYPARVEFAKLTAHLGAFAAVNFFAVRALFQKKRA